MGVSFPVSVDETMKIYDLIKFCFINNEGIKKSGEELLDYWACQNWFLEFCII